MNQQNSTEMVRAYAAANGIVKKKTTQAALGLSTGQIKYAFGTLSDQKYLHRIGHGTYRFCDKVEKPGAEVTNKIWRAMRIKGRFSAAEIAQLAGTTTSFVYKRFRAFRADGYIKQHGLKRGSSEKVWRLTVKGKNKAMAPNLEEYKADALVMAAVNLNRLVCSGIAVRDQEAGEQALQFCETIKKGLEDAATS